MKRPDILFVALLAGLVTFAHTLSANEHQAEKAVLTQLLQALADNDHQAFISNGTPEFKQNISRQSFQTVSQEPGKLIRQGYSADYLTDLYQQGAVVHVWKISYRNSKENNLAKLILIRGKIAGFWLL